MARPDLEFELGNRRYRYKRPGVSEALKKLTPLLSCISGDLKGIESSLAKVPDLTDYFAGRTEVYWDLGNGSSKWMPLAPLVDEVFGSAPEYLSFGVKVFMEENAGFLDTPLGQTLLATMKEKLGSPTSSDESNGSSGE